MNCIINGKETSRSYKNRPVSKEVMEFAKWYRDKLNVDQKKKILLSKNKSKKAFVDLITVLNTFVVMKNKGYSWELIQTTLLDELLLKGLITDEEFNERNIP